MRAVSGDRVIFKECILSFRPDKDIGDLKNEIVNKNSGYLLLDFNLNVDLNFGFFQIKRSLEVGLPGPRSAFISPVILPDWVEEFYSHTFTLGLASVLSFVWNRPVKAPRDGYMNGRTNISEFELEQLAILHPILTAGPGYSATRLSTATINEMHSNSKKIITKLFQLPYETYTEVMQSIRLIQLAYLNERDDFGLSYYLLISAIESIAVKAVKRKKTDVKHPKENLWKEMGEKDPEVKELLKLYKEARDSKGLAKRFVNFILEFCPIDEWNEMEHPMQSTLSYIEEITGEKNDFWLKKNFYEIYPEDLTADEINAVLMDLYKNRSAFTHEGKNPPHNDPYGPEKYFERQGFINDEYLYESRVMINYKLMCFITNRSISNYIFK